MNNLKEMPPVNKNSPIPLYYQLKDLLIRAIKEGSLKPGDRIPSERELAEYHDISRMTVHKAIEQLVQENYLYREKGKGTFVARKKKSRTISPLASFSAEMKAQGLRAKTIIIDWEMKEADDELAQHLKLSPGEKVYSLTRLRLVEDKPFLLEESYLPVKLCPDLKRTELEGSSLYTILREKYHYNMKKAEATVEPVLLIDGIAEKLKVEEGSMGLKFCQTTYLSSKTPIEYTRAHYRSDEYKFKLKFNFKEG
ncbi:GntR family transcriptional regulator [Halothermothrix orenii]|uniref:Transcriptional regulator, GntR family n=1 Tax=Halothermothrix orenii (strain H 168 / OCM 544 / DSM 9562) TaxID=373903 RepID=B8D187_HALOH|nr:GntR family transcriptional regulator [Halothermothrix orenii]ACL71039.1 transcriptional regulator, GntR family [Halothermothrix orenii H 168]